ncbi:alanine--tRNA ligase [Planctomycetales bacterium]|nr:alanine--tRNA ligase [Planctomycetales bacterium]
MKTNELREKYLSFFESKGCVRKPSDVLVPRWDSSVLFTPAGMNQFKDHFLGRVKLDFTRATTCQKCLRTGDIDNVGRTAYHHTFFEMLGNFSFGDYFKREAIHWAWEFLTDKKWLGIAPAKLSATVYKDDAEAAKIWLEEIKLPKERLQYLEEDENFWPASAPSLGPDGVCGPCSEIYHDTPVGAVEIWNLVFTQFNRVGEPPNNLRPLPSKNIDTGMGLERCAAVLQGVDTNYHIDILRPLVEAAAEVLNLKYDPASDNGRRLRRIADHIRACAFAVHENVYPGNKEEKYVIRRLLRRAVLDGRQMGHQGAFLHLLVPKVAELMSVPYPELSETTGRVTKVIETEEEHFIGTVDSGLEKIGRIFDEMQKKSRKQVAGAEIFDMYQTFGFPPELFETMAAEQGLTFDWSGFKREMEHHGEVSGSAEKNLLFKHDPLESVKKNNPPTEFVGYKPPLNCAATVLAILQDDKLIDTTPLNQTVKIVLDKTPCYGEKGGQVGDKGVIVTNRPLRHFVIESTQLDGELIVHTGYLDFDKENTGGFKVGDIATVVVDTFYRPAIERAHSATHLLHYVLRKELGGHAEQQGSKVYEDTLRFDFTNHSAIDKETLQKIELQVNELILEATDGDIQEMSIEEARKTGAMMLFGEKYPEKVRVVKFGESIELCGGTHLTNTSQVGFFKIISEESVSAGTRRITALTGLKAAEKALHDSAILQQTAAVLKIPAEDIVQKVEDLTAQVKKLQKDVQSRTRQSAVSAADLLKDAQTVSGITLITKQVNADVNTLRQLIDQVRQKEQNVAVLLASVIDGKVLLIAGLSRDLISKCNAIDLIGTLTPLIGGKGGGGRPDMAQGGGGDAAKLPEVFEKAKGWFG